MYFIMLNKFCSYLYTVLPTGNDKNRGKFSPAGNGRVSREPLAGSKDKIHVGGQGEKPLKNLYTKAF